MIGDSVYDVLAAGKLDIPTIAVRTGGFGTDELQEAGASHVFDSLGELQAALDDTALPRPPAPPDPVTGAVPPAPWTCRLTAVVRLGVRERRPTALAVVAYAQTPVGPYGEALLAELRLPLRISVPWIVVDSPASAAAGRQLALPKAVAQLELGSAWTCDRAAGRACPHPPATCAARARRRPRCRSSRSGARAARRGPARRCGPRQGAGGGSARRRRARRRAPGRRGARRVCRLAAPRPCLGARVTLVA
jgi:hypothetical protein